METWHNLKIAEMPMRLYDLLQKECMTTPYKELDSKFNNISNILFYEKNSLEDKDIQNFLNYLIRDFNHLYGSELIIEKDSDKRIILKQFKDEEFIQIDLCKYIIDNYSYIPKSNLTLAETY